MRAIEIGTATGRSGRVYRMAGASGECDTCHAPFVAQFALDTDDPLPDVTYGHVGDGTHALRIDGESEAARSLAGGVVIATCNGGTRDALN